MNNDLINYIKQCREQNISDEQIRTALSSAGWKEEDINDGFNPNSVPAAPVAPAIQQGMPKAPVFVKVVAWIMLLGGILRLLISAPVFLLGLGFQSIAIILAGILAVLTGIGLIIASFGLRKMRKWGLYVFTIITGLSLISSIYSAITDPKVKIWQVIVVLLIQVAILVDFWTFRKKFI